MKSTKNTKIAKIVCHNLRHNTNLNYRNDVDGYQSANPDYFFISLKLGLIQTIINTKAKIMVFASSGAHLEAVYGPSPTLF